VVSSSFENLLFKVYECPPDTDAVSRSGVDTKNINQTVGDIYPHPLYLPPSFVAIRLDAQHILWATLQVLGGFQVAHSKEYW
jgi:hypothetical protein